MKSFFLPIIVVIVVGVVGVGCWLYSNSDSVSGVAVINEALDVAAVDPYGAYQTGVGNTTLTFQLPAESLGSQFSEGVQLLSTVVEGVRVSDIPEMLEITLNARNTSLLADDADADEIFVTVSSNLLEDSFEFEARFVSDSVFVRLLKAPTFLSGGTQGLLDQYMNVWLSEDSDLLSEADFTDLEWQQAEVTMRQALISIVRLMVDTKTMVFSSVSSKGGATYMVPYTINVSQLPMVLTHERFETEVLQPISDIVYLTTTFQDEAGGLTNSKEEVLRDLRELRDSIVSSMNEDQESMISISGSFTVAQDSRRFLGKALDVSVDTVDPVSSVQIHFEEMLQKELVSIAAPEEFQSLSTFAESFYFSLLSTFFTLPSPDISGEILEEDTFFVE